LWKSLEKADEILATNPRPGISADSGRRKMRKGTARAVPFLFFRMNL
jgi:hypothetical protein